LLRGAAEFFGFGLLLSHRLSRRRKTRQKNRLWQVDPAKAWHLWFF
jgi:hypothetical protein